VLQQTADFSMSVTTENWEQVGLETTFECEDFVFMGRQEPVSVKFSVFTDSKLNPP